MLTCRPVWVIAWEMPLTFNIRSDLLKVENPVQFIELSEKSWAFMTSKIDPYPLMERKDPLISNLYSVTEYSSF